MAAANAGPMFLTSAFSPDVANVHSTRPGQEAVRAALGQLYSHRKQVFPKIERFGCDELK